MSFRAERSVAECSRGISRFRSRTSRDARDSSLACFALARNDKEPVVGWRGCRTRDDLLSKPNFEVRVTAHGEKTAPSDHLYIPP
ncbi:MAG TPA: hypothetical protein G4N98_06510 [Thermoflexia bacterium]|nr:hypothetical protein [Thermoflexia bacterium]